MVSQVRVALTRHAAAVYDVAEAQLDLLCLFESKVAGHGNG